MKSYQTRVVALAGGVGGAKMAHGLQEVLPADCLTVIVNIGDDFDHFGLKICPDLDTVCYTLSGKSNPNTGWGLLDESWNVLKSIESLGGPTWFQLGDRDLGTHLERTRRILLGQPLSRITDEFCKAWGVKCTVIPATDQRVPTIVHSLEGDLSFQEYFVHQQCTPSITGFNFQNVSDSVPAPGVLKAIQEASLIVICPSNPFVSIDPILAVPGLFDTIKDQKQQGKLKVVAVTPIIGGEAVKGPAAKMFRELGHIPSAISVVQHYGSLLDGFILDEKDHESKDFITNLGMIALVKDTLMRNFIQRCRLAEAVINFGLELFNQAQNPPLPQEKN